MIDEPRKKYDYEEDTKGTRHYFEVPALATQDPAGPHKFLEPNEYTNPHKKLSLRVAH